VFELAETHPGRVEHQQRQPVAGGEERVDGEDVLGSRRHELRFPLVRQPNGEFVAGGVRVNAGMVEHHRRGLSDLPEVAWLEPFGVEALDHSGDVLRRELGDRPRAEDADGAIHGGPMLHPRSGGIVKA